MENKIMTNSFKQEEVTERYEIIALPGEWTIITICKGNGNFQSNSYINEFKPYDCFLIPSGNKLILVPESYSVCQIFLFSFSYEMLIIDKSNRSALKMVNEFLNSSRPMTSFNLSDATFPILENYAAILLELQGDYLPYTILIYQHIMNSLMLLLARTYSIYLPSKRQASKEELSSRLFLIENVKHFISQNYSDDLSLSNIANYVFTNPSYLSRIFKETAGIGLSAYINHIRITKAKQLLLDTDDLIIDIAVACGFNYIPHFNFTFKDSEGITPTMFRKLNKNKHF